MHLYAIYEENKYAYCLRQSTAKQKHKYYCTESQKYNIFFI